MFKRRTKHWTETGRDWISALAAYNSEVHRGLMYTDDRKRQMATLQERFDRLSVEDHPADRR